MPDKPSSTFKSIGASAITYNNVQTIAEQLSTEKGVPIRMSTALTLIVNFYIKEHQEGQK